MSNHIVETYTGSRSNFLPFQRRSARNSGECCWLMLQNVNWGQVDQNIRNERNIDCAAPNCQAYSEIIRRWWGALIWIDIELRSVSKLLLGDHLTGYSQLYIQNHIFAKRHRHTTNSITPSPFGTSPWCLRRPWPRKAMLYASIAERRRRSSIPNRGREIGVGWFWGDTFPRKKSHRQEGWLVFLGWKKTRNVFVGMLNIEGGSPSTVGLHKVSQKA